MSAEDEVSSHNSPGPLSAHFSPLTHGKTSTSASFSNSQGPVKIKRTRQRVDAGEPRNSYASIANFSSTRAAARAQQAAAAVAALHSGREDVKRARVENIVYNMLQVSGPTTATSATAAAIAAAANGFTSLTDHILSNTSRDHPFSQLVSPNSKSDSDSMVLSTSPPNSSSSQMNGNVINGSSSLASFIKGVQAQQQAQQASETSQSSSFNGNFSEASADSDISHNNNSNCEGQLLTRSPTAARKSGEKQVSASIIAAAASSSAAEEQDDDEDDEMMDESRSSHTPPLTGLQSKKILEQQEAARCSDVSKKSGQTSNGLSSHESIELNDHDQSQQAQQQEQLSQHQQQQRKQQIESQQLQNQQKQQQQQPPAQVNGCKKRKFYQPQQTTKVISANAGDEDEELMDEDSIPLSPEDKEETEGDEAELEDELEDEELVSDLSLGKKSASSSAAASPLKSASGQPATTQSQVFSMRKRYVDIAPPDADADMDQRSSPASNAGSEQYFPPAERKGHHGQTARFSHHSSASSLSTFLDQLKRGLLDNIVKDIEKTFNEIARSSLILGNASKSSNQEHESPKELTLLAQMLESKDHHHNQHHHHHHQSPLHHPRQSGAHHRQSGHSLEHRLPHKLPTGDAKQSTPTVNGGSNHRGNQGSPFTLTTESAPVPRSAISGNSHGHHALASGFPSSSASNFKAPFSSLPAIASQGPTNSLMPPSLVQHFSNLADVIARRSSGVSGGNVLSGNNGNSGSGNGGTGLTNDLNTANTRDTVSPCSASPNGSYTENEALSLVLTPKRKRTKSSTPSAPPPLIPSLPTSVAIPNPSLHSEFFSSPAFPFADPTSRLAFFGQHHLSLLNQSHSSNGVDSDIDRDCERDRASALRDLHRSTLSNGNDASGHLASLARESNKQSVNSAAMAQAVTNVLAAHHHYSMIGLNRGSPESLPGIYSKLGSDNGADGSEASINDSSPFDPSIPLTSTLTPMHLRKAKLMFFYVRYPSSAVLKMFFPDIKFNKNNTAQLVKWFSNFREFYYIQMEKYARQSVSEGISRAEDIEVTMDSELLRVLNLHYNRNNHIDVPEHFRFVVEQTLREFFKSIYTGKDSEQSWKKAIYKIIARLDDSVPEYFKSPTFLDQLE